MPDFQPTGPIAIGAVFSPAWLPGLSEVSGWAATALPILGALWLVVQIVRAVWFWGD